MCRATGAWTDEKLVTAPADANANSKAPESGKLTTVLPGQLVVCGDPDASLTTPVLGAAVAVALSVTAAVPGASPSAGGLLHFLLPDSQFDPARSTEQPELFADTGIDLFLHLLRPALDQGGRLTAWIVGGADPLVRGPRSTDLSLGQRNAAAAEELLDAAGVPIAASHTGGRHARRLRFEMKSGVVQVTETPGQATNP